MGKKNCWSFVNFPTSLLPNILMTVFIHHHLRCVTLSVQTPPPSWDPYAMHRGSCLELYYCNMVEWSWWDSSLICKTNWLPSVLWHCWFGVIWPVKIVPDMTYVFDGTLNLAQSINQSLLPAPNWAPFPENLSVLSFVHISILWCISWFQRYTRLC